MAAADRVRAVMVDALCDAERIRSPAVEDAFRTVPRHVFLPSLPLEEAYADEAVAIAFARGVATSSASQPSMMAIMLEQLDLRPGHRVLEIGAGTGYNAALISRIVGPTGSVTAVDIDEDLVDRAAVHLASARVEGIELVAADGALGYPPGAPYDRIVLTVGSDEVRPDWVEQLAPGGRLLLPLAVRGSQLSIAMDLCPDGTLSSRSVRSCAFIRLRGTGAGADAVMRLEGIGLTVHVPEDAPAVDVADVTAALAEPGDLVPLPAALGPADVWDGFGLWLALTEPGTCRLLATDVETGLPDELLPLGAGTGTVALTTAAGERPAGLAVLVPRPGRGDTRRHGPVAVRPFGTAGSKLATRLLDALARWAAAGRPDAPEWRITLVPAGVEAPVPPPGPDPVVKKYSRLLLDLPGGPPG